MAANFTAMTRRQALGLAAAGTLWRSPAPAAAQAPSSQPPPPRDLELTAGPLTMLFEPGLAFLRYIRLGEREVIRGIYAAVRDRN
jgi:hypothetical protein